LRTGAATTGRCFFTIPNPPYEDSTDLKVDYPYLTVDDIIATDTLRKRFPGSAPYSYSVSGVAAPPGSVVEQLVEEYLNSADGEWLRNQYIWSLDEDGQDPATEPVKVGFAPPETPDPEDQKRWCERTPPGTTYVVPPFGLNEFTLFETYPTSVGIDADMLYGSEFRNDPNGYTWSSLRGFGLRKIIAKHGWMPADKGDTLTALGQVPQGPIGPGGRYRFKGPVYDFPDPGRVPSGTPGRCQRVVVVDTVARPGEPRAKGIVTSYGAFVPGA